MTIGLTLLAVFLLVPGRGWAANETKDNEIVSVVLAKGTDQPTVVIQTERPVGYRYTVYDSFDPVRVVVDFPGMDVSKIAKAIPINTAPVQEIKVSSFDLTSGKLGRIEMLLQTATKYLVALDGNQLKVTFTPVATAPVAATVPEQSPTPPAAAPAAVPATQNIPSVAATPPAPVKVPTTPAKGVLALDIQPGGSVINTDGKIERVQYFKLGAPPRLVVDLYGVRPKFPERVFKTTGGFGQIRIGTYADKTRFVYDAEEKKLPGYSVEEQGAKVVVLWGQGAVEVAADKHPASSPMARKVEGPVNVEFINFDVHDGQSDLIITLSEPGEIIEPSAQGDVVGFGVKNADISRALRRVIDASSFPTAVRRVTPYTVLAGKTQDVRFAVELKGPTTYKLRRSENNLIFTVDNGPFAEPLPKDRTVAIPVPAVDQERVSPPPTATPVPQPAPQAAIAAVVESSPAPVMAEPEVVAAPASLFKESAKSIGEDSAPKVYTGQKISLVFDDADIRNILQLIAEVSNLNILASDDVRGNITLRLIDVPWDQALDLVMDIKGLGMVRAGNVVRILPQEKIRALEETKFTAARTREKLEDLTTEVISVNYTSLANVAGPAKELLTERGKLTEDSRNKQLIVTDVPTVIQKIRQLVQILDTPERQVLIDARIVEVNTNFSRDLGVNWGFDFSNPGKKLNSAQVGIGGDFLVGLPTSGVGTVAGLGSGITFGRIGIDQSVLDLRISALETNGRAKVISNPRISTLNGEEAEISQGTRIPYQSVDKNGNPTTQFVDATLKLIVTPVINPDNSVILTIEANNDSPSITPGASAPSIDKKQAKTKVLVRNGETTVIGGIFVENEGAQDSGVPFLNAIPWVGNLFKSQKKTNQRAELMIFVTPRILNQN